MSDRAWWRDAVLYQIYPRSYGDTNGDGIGDLPGIDGAPGPPRVARHRRRLDHPDPRCRRTPTGATTSRTICDVHPDLGTLADLDELVADAAASAASASCSTSSPTTRATEHAWFARRGIARPVLRLARAGDRRRAAQQLAVDLRRAGLDPRRPATASTTCTTSCPSSPTSTGGTSGSATSSTRSCASGSTRGIAGFRIDVAHGIVKDRDLRDNPAAEPGDSPLWQRLGQRPVYSMNRPDVHEVHRRWRRGGRRAGPSAHPGRRDVGGRARAPRRVLRQPSADELHLAFNFVFAEADFEAPVLAPIVARTEELLPAEAWPVWMMSDHDLAPTRRLCITLPPRPRAAVARCSS